MLKIYLAHVVLTCSIKELGKDVSYGHLRVFRCKTFVHIPKDERLKLDVKTRQHIFIRYDIGKFGYKSMIMLVRR